MTISACGRYRNCTPIWTGTSYGRFRRAIGGGAKNPALTQLKADVLGRPITTLAVTEAGCLGAAMLACAATTGARLQELVDTWVKTISAVEPDPGRAALYNERFGAYKEVYPTLRAMYGRSQ